MAIGGLIWIYLTSYIIIEKIKNNEDYFYSASSFRWKKAS